VSILMGQDHSASFLPYNEDFETSAFFNNTNNIKAEITGFGTKRSFDIFMLV